MTDNHNRRFRMFVRVRDFITQRLGDLSEAGVARQLYTQLQSVITRLESLSADQASGIGQAHQRTQTRGSARLPLRERTDASLLQVGRAAAANALPLKAQFIAHEMPAEFIEDLLARIAALETEIAEHGNAVGDHVQASEAIDEAIEKGIELVEKLDGIMRAKYASNRAVLAEWMSASHTERSPKRSTTTAPPPSTGGAPGGLTPTGTPPAA